MRRFRAILARENVETDEGWMTRVFPPGCFEWGAGPWPMTVHHDDTALNGTMLGQADTISRLGDLIIGEGFLDDEGVGASADLRRDMIRQIDMGLINAISVEPAGVDVTEECTETDDDAWCTAVRVTFDRYVIGVASVVTIPAIDGTLIELDPAGEAVAAAAGPVVTSVPDTVPVEWLAEPADLPNHEAPDGLTPRVTEDGRIFGYLATWDSCHVAFESYCQTPWHSASGYAYAQHCGPFQTDDGQQVQLGPISVNGGHFPTDPDHARDWRGAQAHYDDPTACVAYVRFGENEHGVWYSGVVRAEASPDQLALLVRHQLSGDWRQPGPGLAMELMGACAVNQPGFIRRYAVAAAAGPNGPEIIAAVVGGRGHPAATVSTATASSCGCGGLSATLETVEDDRLAAIERTLAVLTETLGPQVRDTLRARLAAV